MKKIIAIILVISLAGIIVGCEKNIVKEPLNQVIDPSDKPVVEPSPGLPDAGEDNNMGEVLKKYYLVGNIMEFKDNAVAVISGDLIEDISIDNDVLKKFYLGETVGVKKISDDKFELEHFKNEDFSVRHTTMGQIIQSVSGIAKEYNDTILKVETDEGVLEFETGTENLMVVIGGKITIEYFTDDTSQKIFLNYYDESLILDLTVSEITRVDDGMMVIKTVDTEGIEYHVNVLSGTVLNFNHSDLKVNDTVKVYPNVIMESSPAQVDAKKIVK